MIVTDTVNEVRQAVRDARLRGQTIGCVPTMGALHDGHVSLMQECRRRCGFLVTTIFVNPTQFGPKEDLSRYPRPVEQDLNACRSAGADLVFMPTVPSLYPSDFETWVNTEVLSLTLEGAHRPGHFRGVTTIVTKLFNIVQPDVSCFGAKDYQQQTIIRRMVRDLDIPVEIVICPTIREADGLAMSSRNTYLSSEERASALSLSRALKIGEDRLRAGEQQLTSLCAELKGYLQGHPHVVPDYVVIADPDSLVPLEQPQSRMVMLIAAKVGTTRLIDNMLVELI